jgi:hypothetical protein
MVRRLYPLGLLALVVVALLAVPCDAVAAPSAPTCEVGAYLSDVYGFDPSADTFAARFRVWSLCPASYQDPISHLSMPTNAGASLGTVVVSPRGGQYWTTAPLQGAFRYHWDVDSFPFDRHSLTVLLTAPADATQLRFVADNRNSSANPAIMVPGWHLDGFHVATISQHLVSNFGDPNLPAGSGSTFSRIKLTIDLTRDSPVDFWKTIGPLLILFLVTLFLFIVVEFSAEACRARLSALAGALLAVLLNMSIADAQVPSSGLTMLDQLHVLTLLWILLCVIVVTLSWYWGSQIEQRVAEDVPGGIGYRDQTTRRITRLHRRVLWLGTVVYLAVGVALVVQARA